MKVIPLTQQKVALVDDDDFKWLIEYEWYFNGRYAARGVQTVFGKILHVYMHRVILDAPKGTVVDHCDGNKLNNQRANLRLVNRTQNSYNRPRQRNNTSGYKGVCKVDLPYCGDLWIAQIQADKTLIHLGVFQTPEDAANAYNKAAKKYHGEFAYLNAI